MRINFRKISAIASSVMMAGMTMGFAAAANYPAPFVAGGQADVAVVYGTGAGVSTLDLVEAGNIQSNLQSFLGGSSSGTTTTTSGETAALDTSSDRIWLNTSLNAVKTTLTSNDLPTVLADYTFSGDVEAKMTSTIEMLSGAAAGGAGSSKVIFARQPKSSNDPVIGISLGSSSQPLYNATITFPEINFSHADSEGESITLFGQDFTISSDTDANTLVLLKEAQKVSLDSDSPSTSVTVGGETYTIELVSASDTAATVRVTDSAGDSDSSEVSESDSKKIQGIEIGVTTADETNLKLSATIIAGAQKLTFEDTTAVTEGSSADPVDGTKVYLAGFTEGAATELAVEVYRPDSSNDAILAGESFVDPVFGSFKIDFAGLSSPLDDTERDTFSVEDVGDDTMSLTMTDDNGNEKTFDFAHNESTQLFLGDDVNYTISVIEGANLTEDTYVVVGNENYGHVLQVTQIYNNTGTSYTDDKVKFQDVISGDTYDTSFSSEGSGTVYVEGKGYTVTFQGSGDEGWAYLAYPTSDSSASQFVVYPTIKTNGGALVALYEPLVVDLTSVDAGGTQATGFKFPDGDGYTTVAVSYTSGEAGDGEWLIGGNAVQLNDTTNYTTATVGQLTYNFTGSAANTTKIQLANPEATQSVIDQPGVIIFEGKDDNSEYHAMVIDLETAPAGTSDSGLGVNDVLFTSDPDADGGYGHYSASLQSDSDITKDVDWWGTLVTTDAGDSDQKTVSISYPSSQVYAQIYVGEEGSSVSSTTTTSTATQLGDVLVKDSEVSSVSSKNLIVVGGSCINSVAANLVGGALCGSSWTDETGVGSGQYLIQSFGDAYTSGKVALLVAGYDAADTVKASTFLRNQVVDTAADNKYIGTTSTEATLQTTTA
jgi:hypothetical protein